MTDLDRIKAHFASVWGCDPAVFGGGHAVIPGGDSFEMVCFGQGAALHVRPDKVQVCQTWLQDTEAKMLFDGSKLFELNDLLRSFGFQARGTNVHYLADTLPEIPLPPGCRMIERPALADFHPGPDFHYAMNDDGSDALALGLWDGNTLAALAAADDLWGDVWQIGIDVLPDYRRCGVASALVSNLAREVRRRGKTPFYTTWPGNLASTRTALRCGFTPAWLSLWVKPLEK